MREIIETGTQQMVSLIPKALDNYHQLLSCDDNNIKLKASQDVCKNTGIQPAHTQSVLIEKLIMNQQNNFIAPEIVGILGRYLDDPADVIDLKAIGLSDESVDNPVDSRNNNNNEAPDSAK